MSILIKGAKMPKGCEDCSLNYDYYRCEALGDRFDDREEIDMETQRLSDCPLVEVLPHGRLIDADEVMKSIEEDYCDSCQYKPTTCHDCHIGDVLFIIANAPTVIESEEQEHE